MKRIQIISSIVESGVVAVLRGNPEEVFKVARAAIAGGIKGIEITMTVQGALDVVKEIKQQSWAKEAVIGVGTVLDAETAVSAIHAGAEFIVSPHFDEDIIKKCNRYQVPVMPGAFTIKEMVNALEMGCDVVKLFPGDAAGPKHIKNIKGPLPQVNVMPTGGVDEHTITEWIDAGAVAVGIGSNLTKAGGHDLNEQFISAYARDLVRKVESARRSSIFN
ncbi:bifunctional 2-keto-4-hydroxyglutarate aldolase/2-keto-3-deoxy-6-phosphogluconate aldolase [Rossellomorea vietnamensis]|uniref:bifunctional 2-keto-4-hydroxyglutarate aldolase/2-keto-3-deoxy-6-phosphogluconate aldolase n=1 Tax=Rossellomorea vietnamensis TaxID=218284 RepID=UPI001E433B58|nr:bifunctional 2-keto-4-hydroxyglutarate aldolase/2-keto-3-deoxy-6-phosphogluconate aldolase [Rossellomorea vietnamensis]MCC5801768.1 bifunctional 2-keto-4-hydroxyglutarate aldolase/2-keto-3-deoxy-6-phosphogluconate aldolase [Rossellomorea vietnamensis]